MTFDLFSNILTSGSSASVLAVRAVSNTGVESEGLGWDDSSVISGIKDKTLEIFRSFDHVLHNITNVKIVRFFQLMA